MLECPVKPTVSYWAQPKKGTWSKITEAGFRQKATKPLVIPIEIYLPWLERFRSMRQEETPNFSVGLSAILFCAALLAPRQIRLIGFDNLLNPNLLDYHKADRGKWVTRHEWAVEHAMVPLIEKEYGITVSAW